jgi:hypothetical protein
MGQIRIDRLTTEEELQMELQRRCLRTLSRAELLAFADQMIWGQWHRERVLKGLSDRVIELEMELSSLDGGGGAVTAEHLQWAAQMRNHGQG